MARAATSSATSQKPLAVSYSDVFVDESGVIDSIQSSAKRDKRASLLVRIKSPDDKGEIVYGHRSKLQGVWRSPEGHTYLVSTDGFVHTDVSGTWTKTKLEGSLFSVGGTGDEQVFVAANEGVIFTFDGTKWTRFETGLTGTDFIYRFRGSAPDDVYAVAPNGLFWFDGKTWSRLPDLPEATGASDVLSLSRDEVVLGTEYWGVFTGNARKGFKKTCDDKLGRLALFQGDVYGAGKGSSGTGIYRLRGERAELVRDVYVYRMSSASKYLAGVGMDPTMFLFDGTSWIDKSFFP